MNFKERVSINRPLCAFRCILLHTVKGTDHCVLYSSRLEAIASRLEDIANRLEAIASRLEAVASRLEAIVVG